MNGRLPKHGKADRYVERHPDQCKPTCPIPAKQHASTGENRQELGDFYPHTVAMKRHELGKMVSESDCAHSNVQPGENGHRERTPVRIHGSTSNTASLGSSS